MNITVAVSNEGVFAEDTTIRCLEKLKTTCMFMARQIPNVVSCEFSFQHVEYRTKYRFVWHYICRIQNKM